jgi:oleandomycin transport system ATP-binding protein
VAGDEVLGEAVYRLTDAGIAVTELSLRLPSLDEVFFTLTGHGTAVPDPQEVLA